ncbi:MAG: sigma-70 family RNA polymerase sigma factor [Acidimicrobiia bacterium]|nr:sigma-70 family RNA polymerase sigma factor [Acidimicrobiia bacterium]
MTGSALAIPMSTLRRGVRWRSPREEPTLSTSQPSPRHPRNDLDQALADVARGDKASFSRLYDELSPAVYGTALRILRSSEHAEEVTQEVFLEVWRKAADWKPHRSRARSWVFMIARARAVDRVRSEQAVRDRQSRVGPGWVTPIHDDAADDLIVKAEHGEVRDVLGTLTEKQRVVVELAYFGGKTYVEVAEELGLPLGTVKTRMRDGLMKMRQHYEVDR